MGAENREEGKMRQKSQSVEDRLEKKDERRLINHERKGSEMRSYVHLWPRSSILYVWSLLKIRTCLFSNQTPREIPSVQTRSDCPGSPQTSLSHHLLTENLLTGDAGDST